MASLIKLRTLADAGAAASIQSITQGRPEGSGPGPPAVEYQAGRVAQPTPAKGRRRRKGKRGAGGLVPCAAAVVEHVCAALPEELWVELMRCGWGAEHFGR